MHGGRMVYGAARGSVGFPIPVCSFIVLVREFICVFVCHGRVSDINKNQTFTGNIRNMALGSSRLPEFTKDLSVVMNNPTLLKDQIEKVNKSMEPKQEPNRVRKFLWKVENKFHFLRHERK